MTPRIVSLIASGTEIACALGFEDRLVGRSHECDFPAAVRRLPAVSSTAIRPTGTSHEIDLEVKTLVEKGLSVYRVDADVLRELRPTHVITQALCDVCAVSLDDVRTAVGDWVAVGSGDPPPRVVSLTPRVLADLWRDIREVAAALGAEEQGETLIAGLRGRMESVAARTRSLPRRGVAFIEWIEPLMAGGNWTPELVDMAGGRDVLGRAGEHSGEVEATELAARDPDVIVAAPCGFDLARTLEEAPALEEIPGWRELRAVREGRVFAADGNAFFNRPGPRLADSLEVLAELIHPDVFPPRHRGTGWARIEGS